MEHVSIVSTTPLPVDRPLLGKGVKTFGIAYWIVHLVVYLAAALYGLMLSGVNPSLIQILIGYVFSALTLVTMLLFIPLTLWIAFELRRSEEFKRPVRIAYLVISFLPMAVSLVSSVVSVLHFSFDVGSTGAYSQFSTAVSGLAIVLTTALPIGVGAVLLARSIKGGKRELAIAALIIAHAVARMVLVERLPVDVFVTVNGFVAILFVAASSAIRISILSDLSRVGWKRNRKSAPSI